MARERIVIGEGRERPSSRNRKAEDKINGGGSYFASPKTDLQFIPTGCKVLDLALGGGWVEGRIANIVGDKSAGKTLLAIEASANFIAKYPKGRIRYAECESAFDPLYARALGMPIDMVDFGEPLETVEDLFEDMQKHVKASVKVPTLYIVDSLDALSDRGEVDRDMDEGTYGTGKAKLMSQLFRRLVRQMETARMTTLIISQVRTNIGATFGDKTTRSGGRALDFYASQIVKLAYLGAINRSVSNMKRSTGINVKAKVTKNKVSLPFREAEFPIRFGYGIDDTTACLDWLKEAGALKSVGIAATGIKEFAADMMDAPRDEYRREMRDIHEALVKKWYEIEERTLPKRSKYGD